MNITETFVSQIELYFPLSCAVLFMILVLSHNLSMLESVWLCQLTEEFMPKHSRLWLHVHLTS